MVGAVGMVVLKYLRGNLHYFAGSTDGQEITKVSAATAAERVGMISIANGVGRGDSPPSHSGWRALESKCHEGLERFIITVGGGRRGFEKFSSFDHKHLGTWRRQRS
jgi:hypothetical protein